MRRLLPLLAGVLSLAPPAPAPPPAPGAPATGGYVALTYGTLRSSDRYRDRGLELLNMGVPGATSSDLLLPGGQLERALSEIQERQEDTSSSDDNVEINNVAIAGNEVG